MTILFSPTTSAVRIVVQSQAHALVHFVAGVLALSVLFPAQAAQRAPAMPAAAAFESLSGSRASACSAPLDGGLAPIGTPALRHCAWSQRIEMLYWHELREAPGSCLPGAAIAWHRLGAGMGAVLPPWNGAWSGQSTRVETAGVVQAGSVWRRPDGQWSAVLWRWRPSGRIPTRNWQAGHWGKVLAAVRGVDAANPAPPRSPLMLAWLDATNGKPRLLAGDSWRWTSDHACLDLRSAKPGQAQLHLPHSRDDARLEQRSAMQVLLARRYPTAEWLRPFTLIEPAIAGDRTGAKFLAVWKEGTAMHGQLWIPLPGEGGIVRARLRSELPAATGPAAAAATKGRAVLIERELSRLAHAWETRHE